MTAVPIAAPHAAAPAAPLDAAAVHAAHGGFLWATLQRLGGRGGDLDDLYQEVFVVVHQRLGDYDPARPLRPWLFGVCVRVVAAWRRRAWRRREQLTDEAPERRAPGDPEERAAAASQQRALQSILDELDLERRAVFVMYEIDELPCEQIAEMIGVPVGTVHSRLHTARKEFQRAAERWQRRHPGALR